MGATAGAVAVGGAAEGDAPQLTPPARMPMTTGYAPDGNAGRAAAFPVSRVRLLAGPFRDNQRRNTTYLLFVDPDRLLRSFRLNYGLTSTARPCGGWEAPQIEVRGHNTGHLMSALALTWANTGNRAALDKGRYLVRQLAALQGRAAAAGFSPGYLSAFPETYFDRLEAGEPIWSPYYMIHKYLAGFIDQYQLAGDEVALEAAISLGDWVDWRTGRLSYGHMQRVLEVEYGGLPEALANLYTITGEQRYLLAAERFYHARVLDPMARNQDRLDGLHANTTVPKVISCLRLWEETGTDMYRRVAENFWRMVARDHTYAVGGTSNYEHFHRPGVIAGQLSNYTCENCVSYNMLKLTRLLHFHQQDRTDLVDYYERALFNQMLGEQDPHSAHGFNIYYTGLSPGAFKQQPLNYFPHGNPDVYATDYEQFHLRQRDRDGDAGEVRRHDLLPRRTRDLRQPVRRVRADLRRPGGDAAPDDPLPGRAAHADRDHRGPGPDDNPGPRPGLDGAAGRAPERSPDPRDRAGGRLARRGPALAAGRRPGGHAADAADTRARARRPDRAGGGVRPGRAERRLREGRADHDATAAARLADPGGWPADLQREGRRPGRPAAPGGPDPAPALQRLLEDRLSSVTATTAAGGSRPAAWRDR